MAIDKGKNISGLIHHLSRVMFQSANQKWIEIGYPDIRTTHVSILIRIAEAENNQNIVAKQLGITRQAISHLIHELIDNGYLIGIEKESDKKSQNLRLTTKANNFLSDFKLANRELENTFIKILGDERFEHFSDCLAELEQFFNSKK